MQNTRTSLIIIPQVWRSSLATAVLLAAFTGMSESPAAVIFEPNAPATTTNFETLASGSSVSTINWTGSGTAFVLGAAPRNPSYNPSSIAIQADNSTTRRNVTSPVLSLSTPFTTSDTLYFSAMMNRVSSASSGARIQLYEASSATLMGGFGIMDSGDNAFFLTTASDTVKSSFLAEANVWYELALVVDLDADDLASSLGYLLVRNVTAGESNFSLISDLSGINMGYSDTVNASNFGRWNIQNFRYNTQVDNLLAGTATFVVPEPATTVLLGSALLLLGLGNTLKLRKPAGQ